jgi:hypothetical protein
LVAILYPRNFTDVVGTHRTAHMCIAENTPILSNVFQVDIKETKNWFLFSMISKMAQLLKIQIVELVDIKETKNWFLFSMISKMAQL